MKEHIYSTDEYEVKIGDPVVDAEVKASSTSVSIPCEAIPDGKYLVSLEINGTVIAHRDTFSFASGSCTVGDYTLAYSSYSVSVSTTSNNDVVRLKVEPVDVKVTDAFRAAFMRGVDDVKLYDKIGDSVDEWLDDHPEATTTVQDGAVTTSKLADHAVTEAKMDADFNATLAKVDGSYEGMTVGNAEQLVSSVAIEDKCPYNFRTTGGSADVGDRLNLKKIVGGTVAWNQLVQTGSESVTVQSGHKYFSRINGTNAIAISDGTAISINDGTKDNVFDLTAMFGSVIADYVYTLETSTAGTGVAWLHKYGYFTKPYYQYAAASLQSVKTSAHKTVGFNAYDNSTGKAKVIGGMVYQITGAYTALTLGGSSITPDANGYFTPGVNGELTVTGGNGTTTCVHLKWDGERDGEYEAYTEHTYAIDDVELRGVPKLDANNNLHYDGDEYTPNGTVKRKYGIVDLGTLNWTRQAGTSPKFDRYYTSDISETVFRGSDTTMLNLKCAKFIADTDPLYGRTKDNTMCVLASNGALYISCSGYSSDADFKTAMNGVYLVYKLATPTTESADAYTERQVCDDFGTEFFTDAATRDFEMPVGHETIYSPNLRAKLEMMPGSPNGDGLYLVKQEDGINTYVAYVKELPNNPESDGNYTLKLTKSGSTVTLSWASAT